MANTLHDHKGTISILTLIAIIIGVVVIGGGSYIGVSQFKKYRAQNIPRTEQQPLDNKEIVVEDHSEIEKLRRELDLLKNQTIKSSQVQTPQKAEVSEKSKRGVSLSNAEIIKKVKPSVVFIETTGKVARGAGSGMVIEADGVILTNAHVVSDISSAKIKLFDGRSFNASVLGRDENVDLALLKIPVGGLPIVELGNSDEAIQGDEVFTLGYPFGLEGDVAFKEGTISRIFTDKEGTYVETSAEILPGNSGGPLVDRYGRVIGINTATFGKTIQGIQLGETIKLAIPINVAKSLLPDLKAGRNIVISSVQKQPNTPAQPPAKKVDPKHKAAYENFRTVLFKIEQDISAGINSLSQSRLNYNLENYTEAANHAQEELILFTSAYYASQSLGKDILYDQPFSNDMKKMGQIRTAYAQYLKSAAEFRKIRINAKLAGDSNQVYGASLEEASYIDKAVTIYTELGPLQKQFLQEATSFFE